MRGVEESERASSGELISAFSVHVYGTPVFQSRDKDEARKGGLYKARQDGRGRKEGKREERCARKKLESRKSRNTEERQEYKARYASE